VLDFFAKLGRLSRIINVGDLKLTSVNDKSGTLQFHVTPGTSVTGIFMITTFFTNSGDQPDAAKTTTTATPAAAGAAAKR